MIAPQAGARTSSFNPFPISSNTPTSTSNQPSLLQQPQLTLQHQQAAPTSSTFSDLIGLQAPTENSYLPLQYTGAPSSPFASSNPYASFNPPSTSTSVSNSFSGLHPSSASALGQGQGQRQSVSPGAGMPFALSPSGMNSIRSVSMLIPGDQNGLSVSAPNSMG
jgi:hypothetical protein